MFWLDYVCTDMIEFLVVYEGKKELPEVAVMNVDSERFRHHGILHTTEFDGVLSYNSTWLDHRWLYGS